MYISYVTLENFRVYNGVNTIRFEHRDGRNVTIIAGNNGYGKTSFLTSLVWCFYGRAMQDVERKYKEDIQEGGGYKKYAPANLNRLARAEGQTAYSVTVALADIHIPALPCRELSIQRTFDVQHDSETVTILIDGIENELTKEVGDDIFVNDFLLPKEIAKFFFFDAEKIVALAEMKSVQDKRNLSMAYSEVLGIKKYEDLKANLEDLRIRFRRNSATLADRRRLDGLRKDLTTAHELIDLHERTVENLLDEKQAKRLFSEQLQEKLIRQGNAMSAQELISLKKVRERLSEEAEKHRANLRDMMELAPFAIAGKAMLGVKNQLDYERELAKKRLDPAAAQTIVDRINHELLNLILPDASINRIQEIVLKNLVEGAPAAGSQRPILLAMTEAEQNEFDAIFNNLRFSFRQTFRQLTKDYKNNRTFFNKVNRQISEAESKENDLLIREIRREKTLIDKRIDDIDAEITRLTLEIGGLRRDVAVKAKQEAETAKLVRLEEIDRLKDETAARLIDNLNRFLHNLKQEKKASLELGIKSELDKLMHKGGFVDRVTVTVEHDLIDILLYDVQGDVIPKESLSKGEQQLYATALLKALVDESNVRFPIFIDSPLQKFDSDHTRNIISEFYPFISEQVVLFPLLKKELTEDEYNSFRETVGQTYLIEHNPSAGSSFRQVPVRNLFVEFERKGQLSIS
ncbi:hypothetical protein GCM10027341_00530 [Spirosoma knui]